MRRDTVRVAAVQLNSQEDVEKNLRACDALVDEAAARGAEVIVLPENFAYFGADGGRRDIAEPLGDAGPIQQALARMAARSNATVIAGGWPERSEDPRRPYNTCSVVAPDGRVLAIYRKLHLFDVDLPDGTQLKESASTMPGDDPVVVDVAGFRFGLSICYDLRFPELYRRLVDAGADAVVVPAAFTLQTGKDHWHVLLRARAVESQCWVVAAAQWGKHPVGRVCYGHALVVDPWGAVVADCSDRPGVVVAELDRKYLEQVRAAVPSLRHRRL